jgi:hypothetical protein
MHFPLHFRASSVLKTLRANCGRTRHFVAMHLVISLPIDKQSKFRGSCWFPFPYLRKSASEEKSISKLFTDQSCPDLTLFFGGRVTVGLSGASTGSKLVCEIGSMGSGCKKVNFYTVPTSSMTSQYGGDRVPAWMVRVLKTDKELGSTF